MKRDLKGENIVFMYIYYIITFLREFQINDDICSLFLCYKL
jgi:hypothetical protein